MARERPLAGSSNRQQLRRPVRRPSVFADQPFAAAAMGSEQDAETSGDSVHLQIVDASGRVVIDRESQGPIFMAHLPDGQYTISAEYQGRTQTRRVAVNNERHEAVSFYWG